MKATIATLFIFIIFFPVANAQKQGNIWYFGHNAGIDFNTNPPTALTNSKMNTNEGSASVSDASGALLFYTNGETVFNKNHQVMVNGTGLFGHFSSTQSAIIIPRPCHDSLYYIITADALENNGGRGYNYSLVNMKKNGGLGEVIIKNQLLYAPSTEMLTVARHSNGVDWWVITKKWGSDEFYCYLINKDGVSIIPVISSSGYSPTLHIASLRVSPDGKKLVMAGVGALNPKLFDFNNTTGLVNNLVSIKGNVSPLGIEFSSNSRLMYISFFNPNTIDQFDMTSYTDSASLQATRVVITPPTYKNSPRGLQMGPDGKIYVALLKQPGSVWSDHLDIINFPESKGIACNFQENAIDLKGKTCGLMFPNIIPSLAIPFNIDIRHTYLDSCKRFVQFSAYSSQTANIQYRWNFDDGWGSTEANPQHLFDFSKDTFDVKLEITTDVPAPDCSFIPQTKIVRTKIIFDAIPQAAFTRSALDCGDKSILFTNASVTRAGNISRWYWDFGDGQTSTDKDPLHTYNTAGTYAVKLVAFSPTGCASDTAVQMVTIRAKPIANMNASSQLCTGRNYSFHDVSTVEGENIATRLWLFGDGSSSTEQDPVKIYVNPGNYIVQLVVVSQNGCISDTLKKQVKVGTTPIAKFDYKNDCGSKTISFTDQSTISGGTISKWYWGFTNEFSTEQNPVYSFNSFGAYNMKIFVTSSAGCQSETVYKTIQVRDRPVAKMQTPVSICTNTSITLSDQSIGGDPNDNIVSWYWKFGDGSFSTNQNPVKSYSTHGNYEVQLVVHSQQGCISDTVKKQIKADPVTVAAFNKTPACIGKAVHFTNLSDNSSGIITGYTWHFGDGMTSNTANPSHTYTQAGTYTIKLEAQSSGSCNSTPATQMVAINNMQVSAGRDTLVAAGQPLQLQGRGGVLYQWSPEALLTNAAIANPVAVLQHDQLFTLKVTNAEGCTDFATIKVKVIKGKDIYVPNGFTPNGDGYNEILKAIPVGVTLQNFSIYNRWGNLVFNTNDYTLGWDGYYKGQLQPAGTFVWKAKGISYKGESIVRKGTVVLVR